MLLFYIGLVFIILGIGTTVGFILYDKKSGTKNASLNDQPPPPPPKEKPTVSGLLKRLNLLDKRQKGTSKKLGFLSKFKKKPSLGAITQKDTSAKPGLLDRFKAKFNPFKKKKEDAVPISLGTSALRLDNDPPKKTTPPKEITKEAPSVPSAEESDLLMESEDLKVQNKEIQKKHDKLDTLLSEKTAALEKSEKTLSHELKNSKEFNKVKDVLEKELKDTKDKNKNMQNEMSTVQAEVQTQLNRVNILEKKVTDLDKESLAKEDAIKEAKSKTEKEKQHSAELKEKIAQHDEIVQTKDKKIADLVNQIATGSGGEGQPKVEIKEEAQDLQVPPSDPKTTQSPQAEKTQTESSPLPDQSPAPIEQDEKETTEEHPQSIEPKTEESITPIKEETPSQIPSEKGPAPDSEEKDDLKLPPDILPLKEFQKNPVETETSEIITQEEEVKSDPPLDENQPTSAPKTDIAPEEEVKTDTEKEKLSENNNKEPKENNPDQSPPSDDNNNPPSTPN